MPSGETEDMRFFMYAFGGMLRGRARLWVWCALSGPSTPSGVQTLGTGVLCPACPFTLFLRTGAYALYQIQCGI